MNKSLNDREYCDYECLVSGAFAPLNSFMTQAEYNNCVSSMTLDGAQVYPMPIVLVVQTPVTLGDKITLTDKTHKILGALTVRECWQPNLACEWEGVFGTTDDNHPYIKWFKQTYDTEKVYYVSGDIENVATEFHENYKTYRLTPADVRARFAGKPLLGFQTRNPLHRSHVELIQRAARIAAQSIGADVDILLHPVEGVTQECDIPFPVRMSCYKQVLPHIGNAHLSILPLNMRMAGPREAVFHALIRKNYGCTHFIVGRDHAGPSYKKKDGTSFYGPYDAQRLVLSVEEKLGIKILTQQELVYCEDIDTYLPIDETTGHSIKQISGTELRRRLVCNEDVPAWFSYPNVVEILKGHYNQKTGVCFYFVGLSGSGKSTYAEALKGYLEETYPSRPVTLLDADIVRTHLSKGLGFSREDRSLNVRRIGYVCSEIVKHGGVVIVANIGPYREDREFNRNLISAHGKYVEFFVDTPLEVCESRDVKGLYAAARAGKIANFTGISDPFEAPTEKEAIILHLGEKDTVIDTICKCAQDLF
jgi:sulfate adenylyltransferase